MDNERDNYVHQQISLEIYCLSRAVDLADIRRAAFDLGDGQTMELVGPTGDRIDLRFLEELNKLETNGAHARNIFVRPFTRRRTERWCWLT